jgi:EAL domain-containing protein (putative c-di-GMP-specific phosphodiesterase class I)
VRVALDDFGAGFASLESLGGWPIDELKLDMSLVKPMATIASFRMIVRTTIDLAHQLGVRVVAEGVESEAVRSELRALQPAPFHGSGRRCLRAYPAARPAARRADDRR